MENKEQVKDEQIKIGPKETMVMEYLRDNVRAKLVLEDVMDNIADQIEKRNALPSDFDVILAVRDTIVEREVNIGNVVHDKDRTLLTTCDESLQLVACILQAYATVMQAKKTILMEMSHADIKKVKEGDNAN